MASWLGFATTKFHSSQNTIDLPSKDAQGSSTASLRSICESTTPPCKLNPFLFNGHLQTIWTTFKGADPLVFYKRNIFEHENPAFAGTFAVDFVVRSFTETNDDDELLPPRTVYFKKEEFDQIASADTRPMLVVLHGLAGGSNESYLRCVIEALFKDGWEACVINSRGCAMSKITTGVLYNARATWDIRQMVKWLRKVFPNRPLFGLGFSLGANILVNYLGEEGLNCELKAAIVVSNPWNLEAGSHALQRTWLGLEVYSKRLGTNMKALFNKHVDQIAKNPRVDVARVQSIKYLYEFDRELQGPTWGYSSEGAYYRDASSCDSLQAVRIPLLALNAEDDPIIPPDCVPYQEFKQNPYAVLCTTSTGGHVAWFETGGDRWFVKPISNFLNYMVKTVDLERIPKSDDLCVSEADRRAKPPAIFEPMRRKLEVKQ